MTMHRGNAPRFTHDIEHSHSVILEQNLVDIWRYRNRIVIHESSSLIHARIYLQPRPTTG